MRMVRVFRDLVFQTCWMFRTSLYNDRSIIVHRPVPIGMNVATIVPGQSETWLEPADTITRNAQFPDQSKFRTITS